MPPGDYNPSTRSTEKWYRVSENTMNYQTAITFCEDDGARLAMIKDQEDWDDVQGKNKSSHDLSTAKALKNIGNVGVSLILTFE